MLSYAATLWSKRSLFFTLSCLFALISAHASARAIANHSNAVDVLIAPYLRADAPGISVAVYRTGTMIYGKAAGLADLDHGIPLTTHSVFDIASMSKQFTAMAIVLLEEDGRLSLDDRITKYIPELSPVADSITIHQLLNHTSGIRDYLDMMGLSGEEPESRVVSQSDVLTVVARERQLNFLPGDHFRYDNTSYALMATLVERISGKSLAAFADERIFRPLGMSSTHFYSDHRAVIANRAFGYEPNDKGWNLLVPLSDEIGDGGVWTTVEDLAKWDANFYRPRVGGPQGIALLQTPAQLKDGTTIPYALGLFVQLYHGMRLVSHGGVDPGYRAQMLRFPDRELTVCVLANDPYYDVEGLARHVADIYLGPDGGQSDSFGTPASAAMGTAYLGTYLDRMSGKVRKFVNQDGLFVLQSGDKNYPLNAVGPSQFVDPSDGTRMEFTQKADGSVEMAFLPLGGTTSRSAKIIEAGAPLNPSAYVGTYSSAELQSDWSIVSKNGGLAISARDNDGLLAPLDADEFSSQGMLIHFLRDQDGSVGGFTLTNVRDTHIVFERKH